MSFVAAQNGIQLLTLPLPQPVAAPSERAFTLHFYFVVQLRVWARPDAVDAGQVDYAVDIGVRILTYFENYFNVPYPLPKLGTSICFIWVQLACRHVFTL